MKHTFWTLFVLTLLGNVYGQNCDSLYTRSYDKFSKTTSYTLSKSIVSYNTEDNQKAIVIITNISSNGVIIAITVLDKYKLCIDKKNPCVFLFDDDTSFEKEAYNDFNCDGEFYFAVFYDKKHKIFLERKIKAIRFHTVNGFIDHDLTEDESDLFYKAMTCKI